MNNNMNKLILAAQKAPDTRRQWEFAAWKGGSPKKS
jgi:hypothetical protein